MNRRELSLAGFSLLLGGCASLNETLLPAPLPEGPIGDLQRELQAEIDAGSLVSAGYALVHQGRIVHVGAVGWADRQSPRPTRTDTPYPLAGLSQPLTALAVLRLYEAGKLELDAPASRYLPALPNAMRATVRQLLGHCGGLPGYARIAWRDQGFEQRPAELDASQAFAAQPPGRLFEYSNLGYALLGQIIEACSGQPLARHLQLALFNPLGMANSSLPEGFAPPDDAALKHSGAGERLPDTWSDTPGATNAYASAQDLARFLLFQLGQAEPDAQRLLSLRALRDMQSHSESGALYPYYGGARFGLGWYRRTLAGGTLLWHEGDLPGCSALMALLPERQLGVAVLINADRQQAQTRRIADRLLQSLHPELPPLPLDSMAGLQTYQSQAAWRGRWLGEIQLGGRTQPLALQFDAEGLASADLDGSTQTFQPLLQERLLLATLHHRLNGPGVSSRGGALSLLRLWRDGDILSGHALAHASPDRLEHLLPFAARLRRV